jgi:hypothetical protein
MGGHERRKQHRNQVDLNNPASIEIHHTFGPVRKSVYNVLEHDESGLSFLIPEDDGYFRPGVPLEYNLMNSGQSKIENFGLVKYYQLFHNNTGEAYFKVGLENKPDKETEPAKLGTQPERCIPEDNQQLPSIHFSVRGREQSFLLEDLSHYSAVFYCSEDMAWDLRLSSILQPVVITVSGKKVYEGTIIVTQRSLDGDMCKIVIAPRGAIFHVDTIEA